jgi:cell shape-determining protein MreC
VTFTDDELISLIEEVTTTLGQIFLRHRELTEGILHQQLTDRSREKIELLKKRMELEKEKLVQIRHQQQRTKELERIRKSHETETTTEGTSRSPLVTIRDQRGRVVGWIQSVGENRVNILDGRSRLVGRFINGQTYDQRGRFIGDGNQGLRLLGQMLTKVGPTVSS